LEEVIYNLRIIVSASYIHQYVLHIFLTLVKISHETFNDHQRSIFFFSKVSLYILPFNRDNGNIRKKKSSVNNRKKKK